MEIIFLIAIGFCIKLIIDVARQLYRLKYTDSGRLEKFKFYCALCINATRAEKDGVLSKNILRIFLSDEKTRQEIASIIIKYGCEKVPEKDLLWFLNDEARRIEEFPYLVGYHPERIQKFLEQFGGLKLPESQTTNK
ncbi:MAG: hypothetical protein UV19_C0015G0004 [Parcubacteria group bacterium GW2011_GWA2_42_28]|nr:MAG: hypothetical protein UV19_C0015G0004 [Parcubacteria group bacterium GW2011_GWA2_42_28]